MNHCKSCKHFDSKRSECDRILGPQDRGYKDIYRQRYSDDEMSIFYENSDLAICLDGSNYYSKLLVNPNFGCVLWESLFEKQGPIQ